MRLPVFLGCIAAAVALGVAGGFVGNKSLTQTRSEVALTSIDACHAALLQARTEWAAEEIGHFCFTAFPGFLDGEAARQEREANATMELEAAPVLAPVYAAFTSQSAEGYTEADFDDDALARLEAWVINTIKAKMRVEFAEQGLDLAGMDDRIEADSTYLTVQGKKLAIIKASLGGAVRAVTLLGIDGDQIHRVTCIRKSNHDIRLWSGPCAEEIHKAFGVRLPD